MPHSGDWSRRRRGEKEGDGEGEVASEEEVEVGRAAMEEGSWANLRGGGQ